MALDEVCKGEGKYAGMDYCHARDQPTADFPGHGKNYFDGANVEKGGTLCSRRKPSSEGEGGAVCDFFPEAGRYLLRDALPERIFKLRSD